MFLDPDFTYTQGSTTVWSLFEMNLGIACVCMTRLKPFLRKHLPRLVSSFGSSRNGGSKGPYYQQKRTPRSGSDSQPGRWRGTGTGNS
ncbi:MFS transporter [Apiospora saccharicola]|uniref:MFS transporter n=1 Tax=Apiospora saccharicola TaxID=335842 RepID=A0ABR1TLU8_9PEZI